MLENAAQLSSTPPDDPKTKKRRGSSAKFCLEGEAIHEEA